MTARLLLATDLDRTLIPNGLQPESPAARPLFRALRTREDLLLAYVSGRDLGLQLDAIERWQLPMPDFAVADVGTTIYRLRDGEREPWTAWSEEIAADWQGYDGAALQRLLGVPEPLRLQEAERQKAFKLSYYGPATAPAALLRRLHERLASRDIRTALVWSVDETRGVGLLDVIPACATKLHAIEFLMRTHAIGLDRCVFAGDSGNDLPVLASNVPSVLVRNADDAVRRQALHEANARGHGDALYLARGDFLGMNGHYAAGILEGLVHYLPEIRPWLESARTEQPP